MAPPPRPPIICYDIQTNNNARRARCIRSYVPSTGATKTPKVTIVKQDPIPIGAFANAYWGSRTLSPISSEENTPIRRRPPPTRSTTRQTVSRHRTTFKLDDRAQNKQSPKTTTGTSPIHHLNMATSPIHHLSMATSPIQHLSMATSPIHHLKMATSPIQNLNMATPRRPPPPPKSAQSKLTSTTKPKTRSAPQDFSFFKPSPEDEQTLEITDVDFFNKVEDDTMLLLHNLRSGLKEFAEMR